LVTFAVVSPVASNAADLPQLAGTLPVAGATIVGEEWLTARTLQLTVATAAFVAPVAVEVMFPTDYDTHSKKRWPVTYYTAGTNHDQTTFRVDYAGERLTGTYSSIVVSPRGDSGYWSDWFNGGSGGPPEYESFVTQQLVGLIDANFRTIPDRAHRAILGESMGGYGSLMLAARHPDEFVAAATLSGAVDSNWPAGAAAITASPVLEGGQPDAIYGPVATQAVRWHGHNPTDLAANLRGVDLQVFTGSGVLDPTHGEVAADAAGCGLESSIVHPESVSLHEKLVALNIPHYWSELDWGCHSTALFEYEIGHAIQRFDAIFARGSSAPTTFDYRSIEPMFRVWDWSVSADPTRALEFLDLEDIGKGGLTITGSGDTTVTTPSIFAGVRRVTVRVDGYPTTMSPDTAGRITFTVHLGSADQEQQYTLGAASNLRTAVVTFD
jgi:S-formylglutathione hydrolase FrmB